MTDIILKCNCGEVHGMARNVSAASGTRIVCYCDDCQSFARFLDREDVILDEHYGTDIFQLTPSQVSFDKGSDQLRCVKLTDKGMYRWYTGCCNTPVGNTMAANMAFVGVIHNIMDDEGRRDQNLGPVRSYVQGNYAKKTLPKEKYNKGFPLSVTFRVLYKMLVWTLTGKGKPSPFFNTEAEPASPPKILTPEELKKTRVTS